jgi:hypothetical protein
VGTSALPLALIHRSAWNMNSRKLTILIPPVQVQQPSFSATETALILVMRNNTLETQVHGEEAVVCGAVRTGLDGLLHRSPPSVRRGLGRELAVRSSQPCREQLDDGGDVAVVQVPQRSVFGHFDQPYPGIREYRAEQLPALC